MVTALDGNVYLLRASASPRLYVVSPAGSVTKQIKITSPGNGLQPYEMGVVGEGNLFIVFDRGPQTTDPAALARIALLDLAGGQVTAVLDAASAERSSLLPGCATRSGQWLFLGSTEDNKLEVVEFAAR